MNERQQLEQAIAALESQRAILGDAVVEAALGPMREKLAALMPHAVEQQRKLVTLLFCDVAGSTKMVRDLDPEDNLAIMDTGLKRLSAHIEPFGGRVTRFMGDGFKALFGHPTAHEDDPEQAIRAGLAILQETQAYAQEIEARFGFKGFAVRVGINTGPVIVGGESEGEDTVMGAAVNLAARMESAAVPGTLLISHNTYQHVRGVFDLEPLVPITVKGFEQPISVYRVHCAKERAFRVRRRGVEGIETRMIGRDTELKVLQTMFFTVMEDGERQVVTISGDPGLGKSRLLYEFENWADLQTFHYHLYRGRAQQETAGLPYALLRSLFAFRFDIQDSDSVQTVQEKMTAGLATTLGANETTERNAHILGQLLGFNFSASVHVQPILADAQQIRNRGLMYLTDYFKAAASRDPIMILLEDLHWADDSSLDALTQLALALSGQPLLLVSTTRPEFYQHRPHWFEGQSFHERLDLHPLRKRESRELVNEVLQKFAEIPESLRELIVGNAEGNPFYVEELIKMLIEDGVIIKDEPYWRVESTRLNEIHVPPTLTGVLQARLDSLPEMERVVLQQASVVGRVFWDAVLDYVNQSAKLEGWKLPEQLDMLRAREMVFHRDVSAFSGTHEYVFKHALLRDVTYETVLKRLRRTYHELAAAWLAQMSAAQGRAEEYAALIADHYELAEQRDSARQWRQRAADAAAARYANTEAIEYYGRLLPLLDVPAEQSEVHLKLGGVLQFVGRMDEAESQYRQALALAEQDNLPEAVSQSNFALGRLCRYRADLDAALEWLTRAHTKWEALGDNLGQAQTLIEIGFVYYRRGNYILAQEYLEQGLALARSCNDKPTIALALNDLGSVAFGQNDHIVAREFYEESLSLRREIGDKPYIATSLGNLANVIGDYVFAQTLNEESLALRREIGDKWGLALSLNNMGNDARSHGDYATAQLRLEESLALYREIGDKLFLAGALNNFGYLASCQENYQEARTFLEEGLMLRRQSGDKWGMAGSLNNLGNVAIAQGDYVAARTLHQEGLRFCRETGDKLETAYGLIGMAAVAAGLGDMQRAAHLVARAETLRAAGNVHLELVERRLYESTIIAARTVLGEVKFNAAWAKGVQMTLDAAVAYALEEE